MRQMVRLAALIALSIPMTAAAQGAFDGVWKIDMNKVDWSPKPDAFLLQDGMYECKTCTPPYKVKANGTDQPIAGNPYVDSVAITVVNDHEISRIDKKGGKVVATSTATVSADGKTTSFTFSDSSNSNGGAPVTGSGKSTLVEKGPPGSHAVSGSWKMLKMDNLSDNAIVWTYKVSGDEVTMTAPTGQSYTAKLDGTDASMKGDPGITSVSVKMLGSDTLEETDKRDGKVIGVSRMTIAADGKSAKIVYEDKQADRTTEYAAAKQ